MNTLDLYWEEANRAWDLPRLYQDVREAKGKSLSALQQLMLRAALCGTTLKDVAEKVNWKVTSIRTELSSNLYRFLEILLLGKGIQRKGRMFWPQIPSLLSQAGYSQTSLSTTQEVLEAISADWNAENRIRGVEIIEAVEKRRVDLHIHNLQTVLPFAIAQQMEKDGDRAAQGNDFVSAIHLYRIPLEQDPLYTSLLVKIATCFDKLHMYADSVAIALEANTLVSNQDHISSLNGILGSAFHEIALHQHDELILNQALDYYQKSTVKVEGNNVLGAWNSFELLIKFSSLKKPEASGKYLRKALLAFYKFKKLATEENSNFKKYKPMILKEAREIQIEVTDQWLCQELISLETLGDEEDSQLTRETAQVIQ